MPDAWSVSNFDSALVAALRAARSVVVLTGAGVSAESGIPTFRDALTGLWAKYDSAQLATPQAFARDPALVTRWYDERRLRCAQRLPNAGHAALTRWQRRLAARPDRRFTLLTQNVDRLHQAAGSTGVVELHGTLWEWRCTRTGTQREYRGGPFNEYPPKSGHGGLLRPAVVWFGESLPPQAVATADAAVGACDAFLSIGTSAVVYPAAGYLHLARSRGVATVEINREPTPVTDLVDWALQGLAGEILPALVDAITSHAAA